MTKSATISDEMLINEWNSSLVTNETIKDLANKLNLSVDYLYVRKRKINQKFGKTLKSFSRISKIQIEKTEYNEKNKNLPKCVNINCINKVQIRHETKQGIPSPKSLCSLCYRYRDEPEFLIKNNIIPIKKVHCENKDGRLGIICTAINLQSYQLHLDHIDGNHYNSFVENIQTLCANCHAYKTFNNKDCDATKQIKKNIFNLDAWLKELHKKDIIQTNV